MKHLKLFNQASEYQTFKESEEFVLPNVSHITNQRQTLYHELKKEKPIVLTAKYNATSDNLVAFNGASNIKSLKVNGTSIKIEPIKNEINNFDILSENISLDMETGAATFPESYVIKSPVSSWSFKAKDPNYTINENTFVCRLVMYNGYVHVEPIPLMEIMGYAFTNNDGVTLEVTNEFLTNLNNDYILCDEYVGFTLADLDMNSETFVFIDTEHQTNVTTGGLPTYSFDGEGLYDVEIELSDPTMSIQLNGTPLISIELGDGITSIGSDAFNSCTSLSCVTIPDSVTTIGTWAFSDCSSLTEITIGNSVASIGDFAFYNCSSLTNITIPNSVTSIGTQAFRNCTSLTNITIPNSVTSIENSAFQNCSSLTEIVIPDSVTTIETTTFYNCSSLTNITIPNSVTSIGTQAFYNCTGKLNIDCNIPSAVFVNDSPFYKSKFNSIIIGNSVTSIGNNAFAECSSLTDVTIGNSVTSIGNDAFWYCSSLTDVTIGNSVTAIERAAFDNCSSLTEIIIPDSVTSIGQYAFDHCTSLREVYCKPTTPPSLEYYAFTNNASNRIIYVPMESVDAYKSADKWKDYSSSIQGYNFN